MQHMKALIVNHHHSKKCGVHAHARRMYEILKKSTRVDFFYAEANSIQDLSLFVEKFDPQVIFYNYYPGVMDWAVGAPQGFEGRVHIGMAHEVTHQHANQHLGVFDYWVATDPSFPSHNQNGWFKTVRPIFSCFDSISNIDEECPTIGSFGFFFRNKGYEDIIGAVKKEFSEAIIRLHLTVAHFHGGSNEARLEEYKKELYALTEGTGITLVVSDNYKNDEDLVKWLSTNDINILLYHKNPGRGISSAVDYCVAAGRPLIISESEQFRHVQDVLPTYPHQSIKEALKLGNEEVKKLQKAWSFEAFIKDYEGIMKNV